MNYWYAARENEIFLDLDSGRALTRALHVVRRMLQAGKRWPQIKDVFLYKTQRPNHYHMAIVLKTALNHTEQALWALWMGSDRLRAAYVIKRHLMGVWFPDIFSSPYPYVEFEKATRRFTRMVCTCKGKHKPYRTTQNCPVLQRLLEGERSADYFPRNVDRKRRGLVQFNYGRISKRRILRWQGKRISTVSAS